jgi:hypothetical protein
MEEVSRMLHNPRQRVQNLYVYVYVLQCAMKSGATEGRGGSCSYSNRGRFVIVVALNHELPILSAMCLSLLDRSTDICNVIRGYLGLLDWFTATHSCTQELPFMENSSMCANQS